MELESSLTIDEAHQIYQDWLHLHRRLEVERALVLDDLEEYGILHKILMDQPFYEKVRFSLRIDDEHKQRYIDTFIKPCMN